MGNFDSAAVEQMSVGGLRQHLDRLHKRIDKSLANDLAARVRRLHATESNAVPPPPETTVRTTYFVANEINYLEQAIRLLRTQCEARPT